GGHQYHKRNQHHQLALNLVTADIAVECVNLFEYLAGQLGIRSDQTPRRPQRGQTLHEHLPQLAAGLPACMLTEALAAELQHRAQQQTKQQHRQPGSLRWRHRGSPVPDLQQIAEQGSEYPALQYEQHGAEQRQQQRSAQPVLLALQQLVQPAADLISLAHESIPSDSPRPPAPCRGTPSNSRRYR